MDEEKCAILADTKPEQNADSTPQVPAYKPGAKVPLSKKQFWRLLLSIETSMLAIAIDIYSIPVAVPTLSHDVLGYFNSAWLGTAFLASFALGFLIWPRLRKGFAYKFSFAVAIEAFNIAASRVPSSKTPGSLIAMRAVSGAGAGATYGLFDMILRDIVPPREVEKYMSFSRMIWAVAAVASPLVAGALVDHNIGPLCFDLFFFPGSIGYIMILCFLNLPEPSWAEFLLSFRHFDYLGTLCLTAGTICMLLVTASGGTLIPWISDHPFGVSISGLAFLTAFFFIEPLVPDPLLHPSLFRNKRLLVLVISAFAYGANLFGTIYYIPHFFQLVFGDSALISAVNTLPMMLAMGWVSLAVVLAPSRHQTRSGMTRLGAALITLAGGLMTRWSSTTDREETVGVLALLGLGQGAAFIGLLRIAQASCTEFAAVTATRLLTFVQALGAAFGVACFSAIYMSKLKSSIGSLVPDVEETLVAMGKIDDEFVASLRPRVRDAHGSSMQAGWWVMFVCAFTLMALSFLVDEPEIRNEGELGSSDDCEKVLEVEKGVQ